jgi:hypothetical protein
MARRRLPLSKVYQLLEPGPVVLLTTKLEAFDLTPLRAEHVAPPLMMQGRRYAHGEQVQPVRPRSARSDGEIIKVKSKMR